MRSEERSSIVLESGLSKEKIFGILHLPLGEGPFPAVVLCHGFGGTKSGRYRLFVSLAERLSRAGIAVFRFDYRGSGDSEGDPMAISFYDHIQDTLQAIEFMKNHPAIDGERLGICGKSMGGAIATLAASACPGVKAMTLWAPMFHASKVQQLLNEYGIKFNGGDAQTGSGLNVEAIPAHLLRFEGYPVSRAFVSQLFSLHLHEQLKALRQVPMLIVEAGEDEVLGKDNIEGYLKSRQGSDETKHSLMQKSDHNFSYLPEQKMLLEETSQWFIQHLKSCCPHTH
jgi:dienelactone hydrolase